ncbi:MAG TPA: ABC transporter permease [Candidatus Limnocylindrales bacterium]|nr:ABC transporter permease [Candidatus Limnocylindrales bacterium]
MNIGYLGRRLASALVTIALIAVINFILFRAMPGSPERVLLHGTPNVTPQILQQTRERWGLDKPVFPDQFVSYLGSTLQGDLGFSFLARGQPVTEVLAQRIWPTVILFGLGEILAIVLGLALGAYSGWRRGGAIDYVGNGVSLILYSTPYFLLGMALLLLFATTLRWFPTFGMLTAGAQYPGLWERFLDFLAHITLPLATVGFGLVGQYAIVMRSSIVETLSEDYVTTARAMGLRDGRILRRHALPNAMLPTVSLVAINLGYVVAGAITVEVVFNWPGLGTLAVEALTARDYPVLQGVFLLLGVSVVLANLAADLVYGALDPRVRT